MNYPARVKARAVELGEMGWSPPEVRTVLRREYEQVPTDRTIRYWLNPASQRRDSERQRQARARDRANCDRVPRGWSKRMTNRANALRAVGLSYGAIAAVLNLDFDADVNTEAVRYALQRYRNAAPDMSRSRDNLRMAA